MLLITVINLVLIFMMIYIYIYNAMFVWYISIWHCMKCAVVRERTATCHRSVPCCRFCSVYCYFGKEYLSRTGRADVLEVPWHYSIELTVVTPPSSMARLGTRFRSDTIPYGTAISSALGMLFWVIGRLTSAYRQFPIASWSKAVQESSGNSVCRSYQSRLHHCIQSQIHYWVQNIRAIIKCFW